MVEANMNNKIERLTRELDSVIKLAQENKQKLDELETPDKNNDSNEVLDNLKTLEQRLESLTNSFSNTEKEVSNLKKDVDNLKKSFTLEELFKQAGISLTKTKREKLKSILESQTASTSNQEGS